MATDRLLLYGNSQLTTRILNADETGFQKIEGQQTEEPATLWSGLVNADITFEQATTKFPADNNPNYKSIKGMPSGSGTVTLRGIKYSDYQKLLKVIYTAEDGIDFGSSSETKYFSLALTEEVDDGSQNRHILFKCSIDGLPPLSTETVSDTVTPRDIPLSITVDPLMKPNNTKSWKFYRVLNSKENTAAFTANKDTIIFPFVIE